MKVSPLRAALRLASVPLTVIEADLLAPETNFSPLVVASLSVPCVAVSVSVSTLPPASASATSIASPFADEKTSEEFSFTEAVRGIGDRRRLGGRIDRDGRREAEPVRLSPGSESEIFSESAPT